MAANIIVMGVISKADQVAADHLEFILSSGEKGESATARLAAFERSADAVQNKLEALQTELIVLGALTQAIYDEIKRMEKLAHKRGK